MIRLSVLLSLSPSHSSLHAYSLLPLPGDLVGILVRWAPKSLPSPT